MKTVVITGAARGFGYELAKRFRMNDYNIVISDINEEALNESLGKLEEIKSSASILSIVCDVTKEDDLINLINSTTKKFKNIDIWINNAGVNQEMVPIWDVDSKVINRLIDIDLKGTVLASKLVLKKMIKQGYGQIYMVEGFGCDDTYRLGLSIYGTAKRGTTYFLKALYNEVKQRNLPIQIGAIAPGIMITDFINTSLGVNKYELDEKTKKVYNILGDYPSDIAKYVVGKIIKNNKPWVRINWLPNSKAAYRFMTSMFNKRDFFSKK